MKTFCDDLVADFILRHDLHYGYKLTNYLNYSRVVCLADFERIVKYYELSSCAAAIVSGSRDEPELKLVDHELVDILDYDSTSQRYNLDLDWEKELDSCCLGGGYDFVMCNQVLEHIAFPLQGMKNLFYITAPGGYIWVSIPTINCIHGEPYFYSAGYHPRMLQKLGDVVGLEVLHIGAWGSKKYLVAAVLGKWLTEKQLSPGFRSMRDLVFPWLALQDGRKSQIDKVISDSWALFRKP